MEVFVVKRNIGMNIFGGIVSGFLGIANLAHVIWTWQLWSEQIETDWGFGTNMEMGVFLPWICEILSIPFVIAGIVFMIMHIRKPCAKWLYGLFCGLFACLIFQFVTTNLFIFY